MNKPKSNRKIFRDFAKKLYKARRAEDRKVGLRINELIQEIHYEIKQIQKGNIHPENEQYLRKIGEEIRELKSQKLTRDEFRSFSDFWQFIRKEKISYKDLKGLA